MTKQFILDDVNTSVFNEKLETGREISISTDYIGDKVFVDGNYIGECPIKVTLSFDEHEIIAIRGGCGLNIKRINDIGSINDAIITKQIFTTTVTCDTNLVLKYISPKEAINGLFSIGENKQIYFSKGNLQYQASTNTWRFAENQWIFVGDMHEENVEPNNYHKKNKN